ncbi:MAG: aromatic amino acid lyase [Streptosporangiales bacterium]|nr:aromatic amino acid lyase [Streptosporangiales bacterium]
MSEVELDGRSLTPESVAAVARRGSGVRLSPTARRRVARSAAAAEAAARRRVVYGRNSGVGANRDVTADPTGHGRRLLDSHTAGAGEPYPAEVGRAALVVRANQLAAGGSGVSPAVVDALTAAARAGAVPVLHRGGGLGTGDLTALAELGQALSGGAPWRDRGAPVVRLRDSDVLPLLSSNAVTTAEAALALLDLSELLTAAEAVGALSVVALSGNTEAYDPRVHRARPHPGQAEAAARLRALLAGAPLVPRRVQDPFGLRALPQVHGPAWEAAHRLYDALLIELNAAAENPLVISGDVLHNGNWHAAPLAVALDSLRLALFGPASLSAARVTALLDPELSGAPAFLAQGPAGSSGAMTMEYVSQGALSRLRQAAAPAVLGTVVLSQGVEDHASFAPLAAELTTGSVAPLRTVLAAELVCAVRAMRLREVTPESLAPAPVGRLYAAVAAALPEGAGDRPLTPDLAAAERLLPRLAAGTIPARRRP